MYIIWGDRCLFTYVHTYNSPATPTHDMVDRCTYSEVNIQIYIHILCGRTGVSYIMIVHIIIVYNYYGQLFLIYNLLVAAPN